MRPFSQELHLQFLNTCVDLAEESLRSGNAPFGSLLVGKNHTIIAKAGNKIQERHILYHPEYVLAEWAAIHLSPEERKETRLYTSGEPCPMCAGAMAWVGLTQIIYLSSSRQLASWYEELGISEKAIHLVPVEEIIIGAEKLGPFEGAEFQKIKELQFRYLNSLKEREKR